MNEVNQESKTSAIKTLAIVGFITAIVGGVWLAVQAVRYAPEGFKTLASLAEVVYSKDARFVVATEKNIVNSGESFSINWTKMRKSGTYDISYKCTDGVSAEIRTVNGEIVPLTCETTVALPTDTNETDIIFTSEKKRFTDVPLTVRYTPSVNMEAVEEKNELVTVVNVALAEDRDEDTDTTGEIAGADTVKPEPVTTETPKPTTPTTPTPAAPKPTTTIKKPVVTTVYPVSNPNGYTDLAVKFIAIGTFNEATKSFTPRTSLDNDMRGAVQFEVKNIGTKTSGTWTYRVTLPSDGDDTYESSAQVALKPNERAVITIAFGDVNDNTGTDKVHVEVRGGNDTTSGNNTFSQSVKVVN